MYHFQQTCMECTELICMKGDPAECGSMFSWSDNPRWPTGRDSATTSFVTLQFGVVQTNLKSGSLLLRHHRYFILHQNIYQAQRVPGPVCSSTSRRASALQPSLMAAYDGECRHSRCCHRVKISNSARGHPALLLDHAIPSLDLIENIYAVHDGGVGKKYRTNIG